ncbi:uncharacterized protein JCM6883_002667 [Sporobolomyces salmoneus]|uniref:uncharacterized protein n=1 Tax=Sporobolomyces salmoneus TaxID=183962 RepID=UPI003176C4C3
MSSITNLSYGLTVLATDLLTAAQAWPALEPTFTFFDLLFLRKRTGTLLSEGKMEGLIEKVPVESWERIKQWVILVEMEDAEHRFLAPFLEWDDRCEEAPELPKKKSWDYVRNGVPDWYPMSYLRIDDPEFLTMLHQFRNGYNSSLKPIHNLVASFGLAHPLPRLITLDPKADFALDNIALIAIPRRVERNASSHTILSAEMGYGEYEDEHTLVNVSLDLPLDANLRFIRFIRTFKLRVLEVTDTTLRCVAPSPEAKYDSRKGLIGVKKDQVKTDVRQIKPRWMLFTSCWMEWGP